MMCALYEILNGLSSTFLNFFELFSLFKLCTFLSHTFCPILFVPYFLSHTFCPTLWVFAHYQSVDVCIIWNFGVYVNHYFQKKMKKVCKLLNWLRKYYFLWCELGEWLEMLKKWINVIWKINHLNLVVGIEVVH